MLEKAPSKRILVVEDDLSLLKAIIQKLNFTGFKTAGAEDGDKGLRLALDWRPDLIILDLLMPKMDGITVLKQLRANFGKDLPIIILTNVEPDDKMMNNVVEFQPSYYFVKSNIELDDVVDKIRDILNLEVPQAVSESN